MIKDLRIHGEVGGDKEFFATLSGEGLDGRYFHELVEREGVAHHRFFLGGNEFLLGPETLVHTGNGGTFCPYMFGVDEPIEDLVKQDVINRLVVFGVRHDDPGKIIFSDDTTARVDYRHIFLRGHAVFNYYFFVQFLSPAPLKKQQEEILRILGRSLKRFPLNKDEDDSRIVDELRTHWSKLASVFFLMKFVNRSHLLFYRKIEDLYAASQTIGDEETAALEDLAASLAIDPYSQERMKIDVMYRSPGNRQVVEEYRSVLVQIRGRDEVLFDDRARISRIRTVALRKGIPVNLLNSLDEKLIGDREILAVDEPAYLVEVRAVLEAILIQARQVGERIEKEDLLKLLKSKLLALEQRESAFDRILIEVGKECDELSMETGSTDSLEEFGNIVTFFDRFDNVYHTVNRLAFHEEEKLPEDKLRSLLLNKKIFDEVQENLFHDLFIVPVMKNLYLPQYGRKKVEFLFEGVSSIETGDRSLQDVTIFMEDLVREEREYRIVKTAMDRWLKKFGRSLKGFEEETSFIADVRKMLVSRGLVRPDVPEIFFRQTLEDLKTERIYFGSVLPRAIKSRDASARDEFIDSSGIDMMRIEELEREFQQQYRISDDVMDTVRSAGSGEGTYADGRN
ncbi:MAG: TIGR04442 family protein [bacterium]|nr:TIGR04442 family protein [bacterium]